MKKLLLILLLAGCTPKIGPVLPDIDDRPGRPRYESDRYNQMDIHRYDSLNIQGYIYYIEKENG